MPRPFRHPCHAELDKLNNHKGINSDSMVLFLAINTSSITLLPTGVIALWAAAGSAIQPVSFRQHSLQHYVPHSLPFLQQNISLGFGECQIHLNSSELECY